MKTEPSLNRPMLAARLQELYGLPVQSLTFVAEGECAVAYVVDCADGQRRFLKLWPASRQGMGLRRRLGFTLPVTRALYENGLLPNLAYPIPTRKQELHSTFESYILALFPHIEGQPLTTFGDNLLDDVTRQIAETYASLHRAADSLKDLRIEPDPGHSHGADEFADIQVLALPGVPAGPALRLPSPFSCAFQADFLDGLQALAGVRTSDRPGLTALRDLLLPRREQLRGCMQRVAALAHQAAERHLRLVLCHTDMGGNNVLVDKAGRAVILDWDELTFAPAEHDLHEYRGAGFAAFLESYFAAGGSPTLDPLQFEFYLLRRYLADLTDWMMRIIRENSDPEQDAHDLEGIRLYSLARLDGFEEEMDGLRRVLERAR